MQHDQNFALIEVAPGSADFLGRVLQAIGNKIGNGLILAGGIGTDESPGGDGNFAKRPGLGTGLGILWHDPVRADNLLGIGADRMSFVDPGEAQDDALPLFQARRNPCLVDPGTFVNITILGAKNDSAGDAALRAIFPFPGEKARV